MTDKSAIYNQKVNKSTKPSTSTKTIKLGDQEHVVVSPHEFARMKNDLDKTTRKVFQLENELQSLKNAIRSLKNTQDNHNSNKPHNPWSM